MSKSLAGFWSYVHADDEAEGGRIVRLAKDILAQYQMLTGEKIDLFIDKDGITWGDRWRAVIDDNLDSAAFFIPVMTPRYFLKKECRREFYFFVKRAEKRGLKDLLLPLHYVKVPSLSDESSEDDLIRTARGIQWKDWRTLRFEEVGSAAYRRGVSNLVERLVAAKERAGDPRVQAPEANMETTLDEEGDEAPGTLDLMAKVETELPKWTDTIRSLTDETEVIREKMEGATSDLNRGGTRERFSNRILILRRLAWELAEPTSKMATLAREYVSQLHDVDDGLHAIIEGIPAEIRENPEGLEEVCQFFGQIRDLSENARIAIEGVQEWVDAIVPTEGMSRDLRPRLRQLRQALMTLVDAREVTDSWLELLEASNVDCQDFALGVE